MRYDFTEQDIASGINRIELDDVLFIAEYIEGSGKNYRMTGSALIDGEKYDEFCLEFETENIPVDGISAAGILSEDWIWHDFVFDAW